LPIPASPSRRRALVRPLFSAFAALWVAAAFAQPTSLPPSAYDGFRRLQGDRISFCLDASTPIADLERAIASAIADTLLVEVRFVDVGAMYSITAEGFLEDLYVLLADHCDGYLGLTFAAEALDDWLTTTRPYAGFRHVLVTADPDAQRLTDLERGGFIGSQMLSQADRALIGFLRTLPADRSWRRLPYGDVDLMLRRVLDGTLVAMLIWEPAWRLLVERDREAADLRVIATDPISEVTGQVSIGLMLQNVFLRQALDEAIGLLLADGTIERLIEASGVPALPGR
jgi:polar amino acid transport system substrate-binding protein